MFVQSKYNFHLLLVNILSQFHVMFVYDLWLLFQHMKQKCISMTWMIQGYDSVTILSANGSTAFLSELCYHWLKGLCQCKASWPISQGTFHPNSYLMENPFLCYYSHGNQIAKRICTFPNTTAVVPYAKFYSDHMTDILMQLRQNLHQLCVKCFSEMCRRSPFSSTSCVAHLYVICDWLQATKPGLAGSAGLSWGHPFVVNRPGRLPEITRQQKDKWTPLILWDDNVLQARVGSY